MEFQICHIGDVIVISKFREKSVAEACVWNVKIQTRSQMEHLCAHADHNQAQLQPAGSQQDTPSPSKMQPPPFILTVSFTLSPIHLPPCSVGWITRRFGDILLIKQARRTKQRSCFILFQTLRYLTIIYVIFLVFHLALVIMTDYSQMEP